MPAAARPSPCLPRRPRRAGSARVLARVPALVPALLLAAGLWVGWPAPAQATVVAAEDPVESARRALLRSEAIALENGEGVERDPQRAAQVYCEAARLGDAESQFNLAWMYATGKGVERSDGIAAFFFHAAAEQGWPQAVSMLARVGGPPNYVPDCMQDPPAPLPTATDVATAAPAAPARPGPVPAPRAAAVPAAPESSTAGAAVRANGSKDSPPKDSWPRDIVDLVTRLAPEYKLHPQLVLSVIEVESNFDSVALSPRNGKGLMQLIPDTAARFGVRLPYDTTQNIRGGMAYLRWLLAYFQGDVLLAVAAYNAGEGAVNRYRGVPPYAETRAYVRKVLGNLDFTSHPFDPAVTAPSQQLRLMPRSATR